LLDDDMRSYTEGELHGFSERNGLDGETRAALVEMVAAALSRNPRRVKQFANNLEGRLRVVRQREGEGRIRPPISAEILLIAKLAILEEEWPRSFRQLQDDPRTLDAWHTSVMEGTAAASPDWDEVSFRRFLSISRGIRSNNLGAFLRLKQSQDEIDLPRYAAFRENVAMGTTDEVESILESDQERAASYARHLPEILDEELRRGYLDGARAVVEATTSSPILAAQHESVRQILVRAVGEADLRQRLRAARPLPLLQASRLLPENDRRRLLGEFTDLQSFLRESPERFTQLMEAFAQIADVMPPAIKASLTAALGQDEIVAQLGAIVPLAVADPELLPVQVASAALERLGTSFSSEAPEYRILQSWFSRESDRYELEGSFAVAVAQAMTAQQSDAQQDAVAAENVLDASANAVVGLIDVPASAVQEALTLLDNPLESWPPSTWPSLIRALAALAAHGGPESQPIIARFVSEFFAAVPADAIAWAHDHGQNLLPVLRDPVFDQLSVLASSDNQELRESAFDTLVAADPLDSESKLLAALEACVDKSLFRLTKTYITKHPEATRQHAHEIATQALEKARTVPTDALGRAFELLEVLLGLMTDQQRDDTAALLTQALQSGDNQRIGTAAEAVRGMTASDVFRDRVQNIVAVVFNHLKVVSPAPAAALAFVAEHIKQLERLERSAFLTHLATLLKDVAQRADALAAVHLLPPLEPKQRETLVETLIDIEVMEPTVGNRVELLRTADKVSLSRGNARRLLRERLSALAERSGDDLDVFRHVSAEAEPETSD
jgi:hypothetical protein